MRPTMFVVSLACLWLTAAHAGEKTYRWSDAQGRVHYSDVKSEQHGEQVQIKPGSSIQSTRKDSPATIAARQLECQRRKDQVAIYSSSAEITETDNLGNSHSYSAAERLQLLERTQNQMQEACAQPGAKTAAAGDAPKP